MLTKCGLIPAAAFAILQRSGEQVSPGEFGMISGQISRDQLRVVRRKKTRVEEGIKRRVGCRVVELAVLLANRFEASLSPCRAVLIRDMSLDVGWGSLYERAQRFDAAAKRRIGVEVPCPLDGRDLSSYGLRSGARTVSTQESSARSEHRQQRWPE